MKLVTTKFQSGGLYEIEPATYRFVAQLLNHCATAVPYKPSLKLIPAGRYPIRYI